MLLVGCASHDWSVEILRQSNEVMVVLHNNDYPRGPRRVTLNGRPMKVRRRGGALPSFTMGPGGFGPTVRHENPTYFIELPAVPAPDQPMILRVDGRRLTITVKELGPRTFTRIGPDSALRPGDELRLRFSEGPDLGNPGGAWGGLQIAYRPLVAGAPGPWKEWTNSSHQWGPKMKLMRWERGRVLVLRVPGDAQPGLGELWIAGFMRAELLRCDAVNCSAHVPVSFRLPLVIAPAR
jgi:hypothetical protein